MAFLSKSIRLYVVCFCLPIPIWLLFIVIQQHNGFNFTLLTPQNKPDYLWLTLIMPLLEEYAFRGALQTALLQHPIGQRHFYRFSVANLMTSLIFSLWHLPNQGIFWASAVFIPSLIFGQLREKTQRVFPCFLLHAWYNIGFFTLTSFV